MKPPQPRRAPLRRKLRVKLAWKLPHRVLAKTFWGGHMEVRLPEDLSVDVYLRGVFEPGLSTFLVERDRKSVV